MKRVLILSVVQVWCLVAVGFLLGGSAFGEVPVDPDLVVLASDAHFAPQPLVRYAVEVVDKGEKTVDYTYEPTNRPGEYRVEIDTQANLRQFVAEVEAMNPRPACVILLGDDVQVSEKTSYENFRKCLAPWDEAGIRYVKIMGNHDHPCLATANEDYQAVFPEMQASSVSPSNQWQAFKVSLSKLDFVVFETFDPLQNNYKSWFTAEQTRKYGENDSYLRYYGGFLPQQRQWLLAVLKNQPADRPVFFCGHHLVDFDGFLPEYKDFPQLEGWIHGHFHKFYLPKELGIRALSLPSSGVLGVGKRQFQPSYVKMQILDKAYRFTLISLDRTAPEHGKVYEFPKHDLRLK